MRPHIILSALAQSRKTIWENWARLFFFDVPTMLNEMFAVLLISASNRNNVTLKRGMMKRSYKPRDIDHPWIVFFSSRGAYSLEPRKRFIWLVERVFALQTIHFLSVENVACYKWAAYWMRKYAFPGPDRKDFSYGAIQSKSLIAQSTRLGSFKCNTSSLLGGKWVDYFPACNFQAQCTWLSQTYDSRHVLQEGK